MWNKIALSVDKIIVYIKTYSKKSANNQNFLLHGSKRPYDTKLAYKDYVFISYQWAGEMRWNKTLFFNYTKSELFVDKSSKTHREFV